jgi:L-seryl-tRNA(Ser) seleniumtransferase
VDALATDLEDTGLARTVLVGLARQAIADWRADPGGAPPADVARRLAEALARRRPHRVINATGVLLHTNLGRAPLAGPAAEAAAAAGSGYSPLEFDLATGKRGGRGAYVRHLVAALTGAEDALVVNNNAGALFLTLAAIAGGREAIVSRGELIEIGGSFRLPSLMAASGALLVEVGTTNRTRQSDYRAACGPDSALILKVHPSNYRIEGFTEEVGYGDLAAAAHEAGVPFAADVGSGLLDARVPWLEGPPPSWLAAEPAVRQTLESGADLVMFSGDKLLGGPQAGIVAGRGDLIADMAHHPIARAVRLDGHRMAALAATLELYAAGRGAEIPFWQMASIPQQVLEDRSSKVAEAIGNRAAVEPGRSLPGAGSVPGEGIPGPVIAIPVPRRAWMALLSAEPPIVARYDNDRLIVDLRAVDPDDDAGIAGTLADTCRS